MMKPVAQSRTKAPGTIACQLGWPAVLVKFIAGLGNERGTCSSGSRHHRRRTTARKPEAPWPRPCGTYKIAPAMGRRIPFLVAAGVVALAAIYVGYWFFLVHVMRQDIGYWTANQRAAGYVVSIGEPQIDGFPFAVSARIAAPSIIGP